MAVSLEWTHLKAFSQSESVPVVHGPVRGRDGAYVATGGGRRGILLGPAMGRITADLIVQGRAALPIGAFDPARFSAAR